MSGHSKWHNIQAKKGKADKTRSGMFTKISRMITVASQQGGGDIEVNFALRMAVQKAKDINMPKDNIERAIKRGTGELDDSAQLHEVLYEGFGPGGVAVMVEAVTDNNNRTASEIKHIFNKQGASLGGPGSVQWQFEHKAVVRFTPDKKTSIQNWDEAQLAFMDAGVDDIRESDDGVELFGPKESFKSIMEIIESYAIEPDDTGLQWVAKEDMVVDTETSKKVQTFYDALDELDDVKDVYTNEG